MKRVFASFLLVLGFATAVLISCKGGAKKVESAADNANMMMDSAKSMIDSAKTMVDSAKTMMMDGMEGEEPTK